MQACTSRRATPSPSRRLSRPQVGVYSSLPKPPRCSRRALSFQVDNLVERLVKAQPKLRLVRLGHPARLLPAVLDSSLEAHVLR